MKRSYAMRAVLLSVALTALGCQDQRPAIPLASSLFIPNIEGVWNGPMTLVSTSGGECVAAFVPAFLPANDEGTATLTQSDRTVLATLTTEKSGLACKFTGSATATSFAMNATECDRTGLIVATSCGPRLVRLVGSSVIATWTGNQLTGRTVTTYNVYVPPYDDPKDGVDSLIATHNFTATRR
jgi:hypothetical protein